MDLNEEEVNILNNIAENGNYLEDSGDDIKDQISQIIEDAQAIAYEDLEPDLIRKLFYASCQLLSIRENENEIFYDEIQLKNDQIQNLESQTKGQISSLPQDQAYIRQLQQEMQQKDIEFQNEINKLNDQLLVQQKKFQDEKAMLERDKHEALEIAQKTIRDQGSAVAIKDDIEYLNSELRKKRDEINQLLDSNARIEDENRNLFALNQEMEGKMASAAEKMDELTDQYLKMKSMIGSRDIKSEEVIMDLEKKDDEIRRLKNEVKKRDEEADAIFNEVSAKTEQFVMLNEEKDRDNAQLRSKVAGLEHRLTQAELAPDKQRINRLEEELQTAQNHSKMLENQMKEAAQEMELNADMMKSMASGISPEVQMGQLMHKFEQLTNDHNELQKNQESTVQTLNDTELHLREVEERLHRESTRRANVEAGVEGLPEARIENEKLEHKLAQRDEERLKLTLGIGDLDDQLAVMIAENDELRLKLEMEPRNHEFIATVRRKLELKNRNQGAELKILEREIENLEAERLDLKKKLRRATQDTYQRAQAEGLTPEQFERVNEFIDSMVDDPNGVHEKRTALGTIQPQQSQIQQKPTKYKKKYEAVLHQNELLELKISQLQKEVAEPGLGRTELKNIITELKAEIDQGVPGSLDPKESKSISKLLELESTSEPAGSELKDTVHEMNKKITSIQEQLSTTPRTATQQDSSPTSGENIFVMTNFDVLKKEIEILKDENSQKHTLVNDLNGQINSKQADLEKVLNEVNAKEESWQKEKTELTEKIKRMELDLTNSADEIAACGVHLEEFKTLREKLANNDANDLNEYLNESITTLTNVRIELQKHKRIQKLNNHEIGCLKVKQTTLMDEIATYRGKARAETRQFELMKENFHFQLNHLKSDLENSVPRAQLDQLEKKLDEKARIIREMSETTSNTRLLEIKMTSLIEELKILSNEKNSLSEQLQTASEINIKLEEQLQAAGVEFQTSSQTEMSARKKVAILEIAELNQRQKNEHLQRKSNELQIAVDTSAARIVELERNVKELSVANLSAQEQEEKMRSQLLETIKIEEYKQQLNELHQLRNKSISDNEELNKYKTLAELEQCQTDRLRLEIDQLKKTDNVLREMLDESSVLDEDNTATVLLLKNEIKEISSQVDIVKNRNHFLQDINDELNLKLLQYEKHFDQKDATIILLIRSEHKRFQILNQQLNELKIRYAGSVPIQSIKRHHTDLENIREQQLRLSDDLTQVRNERNDLKFKMQEYQVKQLNIQELMNTLNSKMPDVQAKKLAKWQANAEKIKLNEIKLRRHISQLENENEFLKNQITEKVDSIKTLELELDNYNQKIVSVDILRAQHDAIVDDLRKNLEQDTIIREESRAVLLAQNKHLSSNMEERCEQLTSDSNGLRSNLTALTTQHKDLRTEFSQMREKLFQKERELVEKDQVLGEYKLKMRQIGSSSHADTQSSLADKQKTVSEAIGMADVTAKMILLEQKAQNAEAKLTSKVQELQIRGKTISRLEDRLREQREERLKMEKTHDEQLSRLQQQVNDEGVRRATELRAATANFGSIASYEQSLREKQVTEETEKTRGELGKKEKSVKILLEKMKKQREIQHQMQKRLVQFEENEGNYQNHIKSMEEDYTNQIKGLQEQINDKINIINNLMDEQEANVTTIPVPSSRVYSGNENNSSSASGSKSLNNWKQLNQRNEKIISQLKIKIKNDEKKISELEAELLHRESEAKQIVSNSKVEEANTQKYIEAKTRELNNELENYKRKCKSLTAKNRTLESRFESITDERNDIEETIHEMKLDLRNKEKLNQELRNKIKNIPEKTTIVRSVQREIRLPSDTKEATEFRSKIDSLLAENAELKVEMEKLHKSGDQAVKLARWDEKKSVENRIKLNQERIDSLEADNSRLAAENERVKKLLIKLQNTKYRSPRQESLPESDRLLEAKISEANREIIRLKQENDKLRSIAGQNTKKGSTSPRTTAELKNTIIQLQKENARLKSKSPEKGKILADQNRQIQNLRLELARSQKNTDSVDSFVKNEKEIELRTIQKKYEKSLERVVKLEDHIMGLGEQLPRDDFWDH